VTPERSKPAPRTPQLNLQPTYRPATEKDLRETYEIYLKANQDLNRRLGREDDLEKHTLPARALAVRANALRFDRDRFWIAEFGKIVGGFGLATRRRSFWYLAALHVLPELQGRGIGSALMKRCLEDLDPRGPITLVTTSDSANNTSTGMYLRLGLLPQTAILQLDCAPRPFEQGVVELRRPDAGVLSAALDHFDRDVLGETRPEDHQCWATVPSMAPYLVFAHDRMAGYIYIDREGALGPAAVERPELLSPTISAALEIHGAEHSNPVQMRIAGTARPALGALFSAGLGRVTETRLLLTSGQFGHMDRYLFSGADALF
jgi:GNAT superfamily N-acetyltransferase